MGDIYTNSTARELALMGRAILDLDDDFGRTVRVPKALLEAFCTHLMPTPSLDHYREIYQSRSKIEAIKEYRLQTGAPLKECKEQIEHWANEGDWTTAPRSPRPHGVRKSF